MNCTSTLSPPQTREYLIVFKKTRLSRRLLIWLLRHPSTPSPVSRLSLFLSLPECRRSRLLTGGGRGWGRSQII